MKVKVQSVSNGVRTVSVYMDDSNLNWPYYLETTNGEKIILHLMYYSLEGALEDFVKYAKEMEA